MSTLVVNTIKDGTDSTSTSTTFVVNGSAKQWAFINGLGSPTLQDSINVSSISDLTTGEVGFNCTNSFSNLFYSATFTCQESSGVRTMQEVESSSTHSRLTTMTYSKSHTTSSATDVEGRSHTVHGELA